MKCDFNGNVRCVSLVETSFSALKEALRQLYGLTADFTVKYADDENDLITIASDAELADALSLSKATEQPLSLFIIAERATSAESKADSKRPVFSEEERAAWRAARHARKAALRAARKARREATDASAASDDPNEKEEEAIRSLCHSMRHLMDRRGHRHVLGSAMCRRHCHHGDGEKHEGRRRHGRRGRGHGKHRHHHHGHHEHGAGPHQEGQHEVVPMSA